eukprot:TRINITY_DN6736_c0_g1_i1.p1 TRINITY_DN6736_c0_g1~~TRINITY_DN6736_c0_g1_i1.p1  ORF type:complete len:812 (-),score=161.01 TRINITY_DN6736_c0_g1_i1:107-2542(-)
MLSLFLFVLTSSCQLFQILALNVARRSASGSGRPLDGAAIPVHAPPVPPLAIPPPLNGVYCRGEGCHHRNTPPLPLTHEELLALGIEALLGQKEFCRGIGCIEKMGHPPGVLAKEIFIAQCKHLFKDGMEGTDGYRTYYDVRKSFLQLCAPRTGNQEKIFCPAYADVFVAAMGQKLGQNLGSVDTVCGHVFDFIQATKQAQLDLQLWDTAFAPMEKDYYDKFSNETIKRVVEYIEKWSEPGDYNKTFATTLGRDIEDKDELCTADGTKNHSEFSKMHGKEFKKIFPVKLRLTEAKWSENISFKDEYLKSSGSQFSEEEQMYRTKFGVFVDAVIKRGGWNHAEVTWKDFVANLVLRSFNTGEDAEDKYKEWKIHDIYNLTTEQFKAIFPIQIMLCEGKFSEPIDYIDRWSKIEDYKTVFESLLGHEAKEDDGFLSSTNEVLSLETISKRSGADFKALFPLQVRTFKGARSKVGTLSKRGKIWMGASGVIVLEDRTKTKEPETRTEPVTVTGGSWDGALGCVEAKPKIFSFCEAQMREIMVEPVVTASGMPMLARNWCGWRIMYPDEEIGRPDWTQTNCAGIANLLTFALRNIPDPPLNPFNNGDVQYGELPKPVFGQPSPTMPPPFNMMPLKEQLPSLLPSTGVQIPTISPAEQARMLTANRYSISPAQVCQQTFVAASLAQRLEQMVQNSWKEVMRGAPKGPILPPAGDPDLAFYYSAEQAKLKLIYAEKRERERNQRQLSRAKSQFNAQQEEFKRKKAKEKASDRSKMSDDVMPSSADFSPEVVAEPVVPRTLEKVEEEKKAEEEKKDAE